MDLRFDFLEFEDDACDSGFVLEVSGKGAAGQRW